MHASIRREPHRLAESLLRSVRKHRARHQRIDAADPPVVAALERAPRGAFEVVERLRVEPGAERVDDQDGRLVERRRKERARRVPVVMVHDADAIDRIVETQLEVIVLELAIAGAAVEPPRQPRVVRIEVVNVLERLETERLQAVMNAAERKRVGVLDARETFLADRHVIDGAAGTGDADQRRGRFVVREVRNSEDVPVLAH